MQDGPGAGALLVLGPAAPWGCVPVGSTAPCLVDLQRSKTQICLADLGFPARVMRD